jgi:ubiquitin C-terminal hydrolase
LENLIEQVESQSDGHFESAYQLLYYIQCAQIAFNTEDTSSEQQQRCWTRLLYRLLGALVGRLTTANKPLLFETKKAADRRIRMGHDVVLLECCLILFKLLGQCLFQKSVLITSELGSRLEDDASSSSSGASVPRKKLKRTHPVRNNNQTAAAAAPQPQLPTLNWSLFKQEILLESGDQPLAVENFFHLIISVQLLAVYASDNSVISSDLLFASMQLLVASLSDVRCKRSFTHPQLATERLNWFKALLFEDSPLARRDPSDWIYRLVQLECDEEAKLGLVTELLSLLQIAVKLKPTGISKEYFHLATSLVASLSLSGVLMLAKSLNLFDFLLTEIRARESYEGVAGVAEDDVLVGLLSLGLTMEKCLANSNNNNNNASSSSLPFIDELFDNLFRIATQSASFPRAQLPKCRSVSSRALCFDLLLELCRSSRLNFKYLFGKLIRLNNTNTSGGNEAPTPQWDYWPRDDVRTAGYVGLVNLGATCYMATAMQQLFMIREARETVLGSRVTGEGKYDQVLLELKRMFAYLQESERKAFSPREFCKVYTMDGQLLNTSEQKDMQEFFTDLISKLEETSNGQLKPVIKELFGGVITNLVISLDCPHVSCNLEEFYTVRCQVAGMKDLYESLNEITVKDTLEGDNMYTCSKCSRKVRAEKRACFRQLPKILCFNTMRYTFNMITMLKEKVNQHFSFPRELNMSGYMERNLRRDDEQTTSQNDNCYGQEEEEQEFIYDLIGVTVHTGTAEGGHYYSFIRERTTQPEQSDPVVETVTAAAAGNEMCVENNNSAKKCAQLDSSSDESSDETDVIALNTTTSHGGNVSLSSSHSSSTSSQQSQKTSGALAQPTSSNGTSTENKWYLFNDADVKPFDAASQLAAECFGGETTSKTYDSAADKFMDLSFEKTNSAYMLFYERRQDRGENFKAQSKNKKYILLTRQRENILFWILQEEFRSNIYFKSAWTRILS